MIPLYAKVALVAVGAAGVVGGILFYNHSKELPGGTPPPTPAPSPTVANAAVDQIEQIATQDDAALAAQLNAQLASFQS